MSDFLIRSARSEEIAGALNQPGLLTMPGFKPHMCRVGLLDDTIISYVVIQRSVLRYGMRLLRVAGLGQLYLLPDYREKGYDSLMIQDTLTYLQEQGAHMALVRDDEGYYDRFGFISVWPEYVMAFDARQAVALQSNQTVQLPQPEHLPQIAQLHEQHWGGRVTFRRSPELWMWRLAEDPARQILVTTDKSGAVNGYVSGYDLLGEEIEVVADSIDAAASLMAEISRQALHDGRELVRWPVTPDDALALFARDLLDIAVSAYYRPNRGWMGRIVDTAALIEAILPELTAQAQTTYPDFQPNALILEPGPAHVEIRLRGRKPVQCRLTYRDFIQVMFGSLSPHVLAFREQLDPDALLLLGSLFPPRMAALGHWDWF